MAAGVLVALVDRDRHLRVPPHALPDALLQYRSGEAAEVATARRLLRQVVERPAGTERPWGVVEDEDAVAQARALLAKYPG